MMIIIMWLLNTIAVAVVVVVFIISLCFVNICQQHINKQTHTPPVPTSNISQTLAPLILLTVWVLLREFLLTVWSVSQQHMCFLDLGFCCCCFIVLLVFDTLVLRNVKTVKCRLRYVKNVFVVRVRSQEK